jgi:hypothetical protein
MTVLRQLENRMRISRFLLLGLLAAATLTSPLAAQSGEAAFTHKRMASAGFIPLDEMRFGNRDVRRVLPIDPYGMLPIPGIELERHSDGRSTLRAQYRGWTGTTYPVSQAEWDRLALLEPAAFAPPGKNGFEARPDVVVHCWSGLLEASPGEAAHWSGCNSGTRAAQAYSDAVLALAMQKKDCTASGKDIWWRFSDCFADAARLDDPALQQRFSEITARWTRQRESGADILMKARVSLRAARADRTPALVAEAREAVFACGRQQKALRDILNSSFAAFPETSEGSGRNAVILAQTRREWDRGIAAQNHNYIGLLEDLARLMAEASEPPG